MQEPLNAYLKIIQEFRPDLIIMSSEINQDGLANDSVIINQEYVFRFPKTDAARKALAYEQAIVEVISQHVDLNVPLMTPFAQQASMYRFIEGQALYRHTLLRMPETVQNAYAQALGTFLKQLHTIPLTDLPAAPWKRTTPEPVKERYLAKMDGIKAQMYPYFWADQKAWIEDLFAPLQHGQLDLDAFEPAFIHADLASYHILHNVERQQVIGILDFGTAGQGDPAIDFATLINTYGESMLQRMSTYQIDSATLERARFYASWLELEWAINGLSTNDPSWFLVHLGRARDSQPWGVQF